MSTFSIKKSITKKKGTFCRESSSISKNFCSLIFNIAQIYKLELEISEFLKFKRFLVLRFYDCSTLRQKTLLLQHESRKFTKGKITLDEVINQSFKYWKATLSFQFVVTVLYFGIIFISLFQLVQYYFGDKLYIFTPELLQDPIKFNLKIRELLATENGSYFQIVLSLLKASLFP